MRRRRWFVVWHQDSPGTRVTVRRWRKPRHPFARVGEPFVYGRVYTFPQETDLTGFDLPIPQETPRE